MATITERFIKNGGQSAVHTVVSGDAAAADTVDISSLDPAYPHCFLSVQMFDGSGDQILDGSATGSFAVQVGTVNSGHLEDPPVATIDAADPVTVDWAANTSRVVVTPTSLVGVTTWRVVVTMNRS